MDIVTATDQEGYSCLFDPLMENWWLLYVHLNKRLKGESVVTSKTFCIYCKQQQEVGRSGW